MAIFSIPSPASFWQTPAAAAAVGVQLQPQYRLWSASSPGEATGGARESRVSSRLRGCRAGTQGRQAPLGPVSPGPECSPAGEPLGVSWGPTLPGWAPGSSGRCLPAARSPEKGGKDNRLAVSGGSWVGQQRTGRERKHEWIKGQTEVKLLTWRAACRSRERRDAVARSRSRPWISCSSLCPGRGESQGGQVTPLTGLASSQACPGPQAGAGKVV